MSYFDLPLPELEAYAPDLSEPEDFDAFWTRTLAESPFAPSSVTITPVTTPLLTHRVHDVTFGGYAGDPIRAWLITPAEAERPLPAVVEFLGMGGGRGMPQDHLTWAAAGYAHLVMDTRGQGSHWGSGGDTPDPHGTGPAAAGFATHGLQSPDDYLYRRLFVDAHHAVEAAAVLPEVDAARIAVTGVSQGGGMAIAAAGLNHRVIAAMPDVPFMCALPRAVGLTDDPPYADIAGYLAVHRDEVEQAYRTLAYFDAALLGARAACPALFSTGLMDTTCPPSTVFAARNLWGQASAKPPARPQIRVYPFNGHEGGESYQWREQVAWLATLLRDLQQSC
ncbi:cephalosporin-C deacetylase [Actinomyces ruminicola]|uniref:Cephalosporin-C deacetylase n=1 Tax=Actinomyces ruminicola TaxID=332524 RepID=A0A1H0ACR4_9ACTO|nr:acetylxylan esterase [Actinomyces ruminicola]SDN30753.1 cephalosporin-C deacetylase [Actinomyces ruminicola]